MWLNSLVFMRNTIWEVNDTKIITSIIFVEELKPVRKHWSKK